jgi:dTDP-4-dehydrorhamnose 3,5-epimerase
MIFTATALAGAFVVEPEPFEDERGFFARSFCSAEFATRGLNPRVAQCAISLTRRRGTLRGLHYQRAPHTEAKLVRCTAGAIHDVIVDLRPASPSFRQHFGLALDARGLRMLYVPEGCAHGFQALEDGTEVFYQMSEHYVPEAAAGIRWNDPAFGIVWPLAVTVISERDRTCPDFREDVSLR